MIGMKTPKPITQEGRGKQRKLRNDELQKLSYSTLSKVMADFVSKIKTDDLTEQQRLEINQIYQDFILLVKSPYHEKMMNVLETEVSEVSETSEETK